MMLIDVLNKEGKRGLIQTDAIIGMFEVIDRDKLVTYIILSGAVELAVSNSFNELSDKWKDALLNA